MNKTSICLSAFVLALLLPLAGCGKNETPASEVAQQQPLQQRVDELLKKAQTGDAEAETELAELYATGQGLQKDAAKAAEWFRKAAEQGVAKAQFRLGELYSSGDGVPQDAARATDLTKQAAINGYAKAQATLADMYAKGKGVVHDDVLAYVWSSLALSQGEQGAQQVKDSVPLNSLLKEEAGRLQSHWKRGVEIVREKQEDIVPTGVTKKPSGL